MPNYPAIARELNRRILEKPEERLLIIQEFYSKMVAEGDGEGADFVLTLRSITMAHSHNSPPGWLLKAGFSIGLLTLIFFMAVVGASIFGRPVPDTGKFPVLIVFALGSALSASFLTGHATMSGQIPFLEGKSPIVASASGGFAVLFLILILGYTIYIR